MGPGRLLVVSCSLSVTSRHPARRGVRASLPPGMDFDLSEDQISLRDGARELLDGVCPPEAVREVVEAQSGRSDRIWSAMVEQGWLGVGLAEARGGLGFGMVELAVLLEEIGR